MMKSISFALLASALLGGANGFAPPKLQSAKTADLTKLNINPDGSTGWDSFCGNDSLELPSGEGARKFRRTVYTHDDWVLHRSQDRFIDYVAAIFKSGVYKNLDNEVRAMTFVAGFVVVWNCITGGYTDLEGIQQAALRPDLPVLSMPLSAFTLTSPSLGLLLVFRTNSSYKRWDEARKNWGMNINHTRDLVRMANCYYDDRNVTPEQRADDLNHVALCTWAFVRSMKRHLSPEWEDETAFQEELYEKLPQQQAQMILDAAHRPNRALQDLSYAIDDLPMHFIRKNEIHKAATIFEDNLGSSERILTSPVPLFYSRHLARYLAVWLFLLPLGTYDAFSGSWNHIAMIPTTAVITTMLAGIEEIGTQLEEPFTVLPMQAFCDKIYNWCMEIVSWTPGDNGRIVNSVKTEHAFFTSGDAPAMNGAANGYAAPPVAAAPAPVYEPAPVAAAPVEYAAPPAEYAAPPAPESEGPSQEELNRQWAAAAMGRR
uniref:Bestrophin homolog n=1 Tax=Ditylum brightwellii TaxID=49249 RepID=A0A7S1YR76_9STRA|mmetsp:Transcript_14273/g.21429  ORF Transcript_14273/g.21429 Transcript_14273/m.21429 type:complete len:487 (+) Transcript_14273:3-1463(+)